MIMDTRTIMQIIGSDSSDDEEDFMDLMNDDDGIIMNFPY